MISNDPLVLDGTLANITAGVRVDELPSDTWWESGALRAIRAMAATGKEFTASDLTALGVDTPDHPSRWGSVFAKAKQLKLIRKVGYGTSKREGRNGGSCAIWQGVDA